MPLDPEAHRLCEFRSADDFLRVIQKAMCRRPRLLPDPLSRHRWLLSCCPWKGCCMCSWARRRGLFYGNSVFIVCIYLCDSAICNCFYLRVKRGCYVNAVMSHILVESFGIYRGVCAEFRNNFTWQGSVKLWFWLLFYSSLPYYQQLVSAALPAALF